MCDFLRKVTQFEGMKLWTSDRKPKKMAEIIGNREICQIFQHYLDNGNIPNVILTGEHGTAKRTIAHIATKQYLNKDYKKACLEIDGAIYRGKDVISSGRNTSTSSKQGLPFGPNVLEFSTYRIRLPVNKHKIIIIYNFDDMTIEAQNALRTIMEKYASTTRFILICNYIGNIIEAIQSRCVQLQTKGLTYEEANELFVKLAGSEVSDQIKHLVVMLSDGDYKKLINYAQVINGGAREEAMKIEEFYNLFNIPPIKTIEKILIDIYKGNDVYDTIKKYLVDQGHAYNGIIDIVCKILVFHVIDIPEDVRYIWLGRLAKKYREITQNTHEVHTYTLFALLYDNIPKLY